MKWSAASPLYAGFRFPAEVISHAVWLYFRLPLSLRKVEEMLAARGILVSYERYDSGRPCCTSRRHRRLQVGWRWGRALDA